MRSRIASSYSVRGACATYQSARSASAWAVAGEKRKKPTDSPCQALHRLVARLELAVHEEGVLRRRRQHPPQHRRVVENIAVHEHGGDAGPQHLAGGGQRDHAALGEARVADEPDREGSRKRPDRAFDLGGLETGDDHQLVHACGRQGLDVAGKQRAAAEFQQHLGPRITLSQTPSNACGEQHGDDRFMRFR
jgi:hypothetical protein